MSGTLMISVGSRRLRSWCDVALLLQGLRSPVLGIMGVLNLPPASHAVREQQLSKPCVLFLKCDLLQNVPIRVRLNQPCSYFGTFTLVSSEGVCEGALAMNPRLTQKLGSKTLNSRHPKAWCFSVPICVLLRRKNKKWKSRGQQDFKSVLVKIITWSAGLQVSTS